MSKTLKISFSMVLMTAVSGCFQPAPPPFDLRSLQIGERSASREVLPQPRLPLPTTLESTFLTTGQTMQPSTAPSTTGPSLESDVTLRLPLQEVIHRAVANNLDVKVAGFQPAIDETQVTAAEARFDPTFFQNFSYERRDREQGLFATNNGEIYTSQTGIRQILPSGGQAELRYDAGWTEPTSAFSNQFWENNIVLEVTQPLLRDFGNEINRARITINRNNQRISLLEFRKQLEATTSEIETVYWRLVAAEREVKIAEGLLNETVKTGDILFRRRGQDVTRVQLSQANASIEQRRAVLIRTKARVRELSDQLKQLMNDPDMPISSGVLILPAQNPVEEPLRFDLSDQINTAMENRLELGQQQFRIDSADIAVTVAKNNLLPQFNIVGSVGVQGLDEDLNETVEDQYKHRNLNYTIGFQFEIPIGNREAKSIHLRAVHQRGQALVQYSNIVSEIALEIKTALREVETTWDEMRARRLTRFAQADALLAIEQREAGGEALTPTFVQLKLDTQERYALAYQDEVNAVSNYNIAIALLELRKGTLLRYNNILMEEEMIPKAYMQK